MWTESCPLSQGSGRTRCPLISMGFGVSHLGTRKSSLAQKRLEGWWWVHLLCVVWGLYLSLGFSGQDSSFFVSVLLSLPNTF